MFKRLKFSRKVRKEARRLRKRVRREHPGLLEAVSMAIGTAGVLLAEILRDTDIRKQSKRQKRKLERIGKKKRRQVKSKLRKAEAKLPVG